VIIISNPLNLNIKTIELFDFSGRVVQKWAGLESRGNVLQLENVLTGMYVLKIETEFGVTTEKLLVR
jgi:hypothetical protein